MSSTFPPAAPKGFELSVRETHRIARWPGNRKIMESTGLGWHDLYAALATVNAWSGVLDAVDHYCLAYCVNRPAALRRTVIGDGSPTLITLRPRQLFIIPAHQATDWQRHGTSDMFMVYLRRQMIERIAGEMFDLDPSRARLLPLLGSTDPMLEQLVLAILDAMRLAEGGNCGLYADDLARTVAARLLRNHAVNTPRLSPASAIPRSTTPGLSRVRTYIEEHLGGDLRLEHLAREAGIDTHVFTRAFRRAFDITPHQYVLERRLERAKRLLVDTDMPIVEIALRAGFSSQSHLSTAFRRLTGTSPAAYRRGDDN